MLSELLQKVLSDAVGCPAEVFQFCLNEWPSAVDVVTAEERNTHELDALKRRLKAIRV